MAGHDIVLIIYRSILLRQNQFNCQIECIFREKSQIKLSIGKSRDG